MTDRLKHKIYLRKKYKDLGSDVHEVVDRLSYKYRVIPSDGILREKNWMESDYLMFFNSKNMIWYKPKNDTYKLSQTIGSNDNEYQPGALKFLSSL